MDKARSGIIRDMIPREERDVEAIACIKLGEGVCAGDVANFIDICFF